MYGNKSAQPQIQLTQQQRQAESRNEVPLAELIAWIKTKSDDDLRVMKARVQSVLADREEDAVADKSKKK